MEAALRREGYRVVVEADSSKIAELLASGDIEAIIADSDLRPVSGLEVLKFVRAHLTEFGLPFLFLSSERDPQLRTRAFDAGADEWIVWPVANAEILARLGLSLEKRRREKLAARVSSAETDFHGELADASLSDWIELMASAKRTATLKLYRGDMTGAVGFVDGTVKHAEVGRLRGMPAIRRAFVLEGAEYELVASEVLLDESVSLETPALLEDLARYAERFGRLLEAFPSSSAPLVVNERVFMERLSELPDTANRILRECDGTRTLWDLLDRFDDDIDTAERIASLLDDGVLLAASPRRSQIPSAFGDVKGEDVIAVRRPQATLPPPPLENPVAVASPGGLSIGVLSAGNMGADRDVLSPSQDGLAKSGTSIPLEDAEETAKSMSVNPSTASASGHPSPKRDEAKMSKKANKRKKGRSLAPAAPSTPPPSGNVIQFPTSTRVVTAPQIVVGGDAASPVMASERPPATELRAPSTSVGKQTMQMPSVTPEKTEPQSAPRMATSSDSFSALAISGEHPDLSADFFAKGHVEHGQDDEHESEWAGIPRSDPKKMAAGFVVAGLLVAALVGVYMLYQQKFAAPESASPMAVHPRLPSAADLDRPAVATAVAQVQPSAAATPQAEAPSAAAAEAPAAEAPLAAAAEVAVAPAAAEPAAAPAVPAAEPAPVVAAVPAAPVGNYEELFAAAKRARGGRASTAWEAAIAANPNGAEALAGYGFFLLNRGDMRRAVEFAQRAVAIDPTSSQGWITLGAAKGELGDRAGAREAYRNCVSQGVGAYVRDCRAMR